VCSANQDNAGDKEELNTTRRQRQTWYVMDSGWKWSGCFSALTARPLGFCVRQLIQQKSPNRQAGFNVRYSGCLLFIYVNTSNKFCNDNLDNPFFSRGWKLVVVMMKLTALPAFQLY
jgi:hypothetical protein